MDLWVVIDDAAHLSLDSAAALIRARRPNVCWVSVSAIGSAANTDVPDGLAWLVPDTTRSTADLDDLIGGTQPIHLVASRTVGPEVRRRVSAAVWQGASAHRVTSAPAVVGPDGAPLWRVGATNTVIELRDQGFEPDGVRRFLDVGDSIRAIYFDRDTLGRSNRDAILAMDADERRRRIREHLPAEVRTADDAFVERLWTDVAPRLTRFDEVSEFLAYLGGPVSPPALTDLERTEIAELARGLGSDVPTRGRDAVARVDDAALHDGDVPRRRRLVRWAITGQAVAPSLEAVWDHLGADEALARLVRASGGEFSLEPDPAAR